ncbi:hypothetical protein PAE9249_01848 [Paenibacillus sp. CECT 9249]|nr:hypothetical protein PAE9249_01848 [Paenibacillus sp. CECT 9249]
MALHREMAIRTVRPLFGVKTAYLLFRRTLVPLFIPRRACFCAFAADKGSSVRKLSEIGPFVTINVSVSANFGSRAVEGI